ncbi:electron transfer flavoprotein subunit alpha/FixB family protein [Lactobacillus sp. ESL0791]|uniref:electron transfer flavoprotein subunit alpha/FixB family protein n=1 Tax=Lactobacillus sp. ESL0791 TaxID=2983234 RepID=UPI0023F74DD9|nr:electron transfer flavoprotein subunit alpha/FixB family protein [Lactobacillus sp. ESL0791]MDF7639906.1 electron transfer flavoprotein subunit alpha/FixB family protein [Lactobacillus sp. ESL0791]
MTPIYYIQIEDKNIDEGHNTNTLAGLSSNFANPVKVLVFSNHAADIKDKYAKAGIPATIYNNEQYCLTDFKAMLATLKNIFMDKEEYFLITDDNKLGNSVGQRLAAVLETAFVPHVKKINQKPNETSVDRIINQGKVLCETPLNKKAIISVALNGLTRNGKTADVNVVDWQVNHNAGAVYTANNNSNNDLAYAKVIVAGGKGLGAASKFDALKVLAQKLNASVGATKAVTDQGWVNSSKMIGISNLTVKPDVYYAFGISGAIQHTIGMNKAKCVVAVNTDKTAPIFKLADYGIIGDANEVIEKLIALL